MKAIGWSMLAALLAQASAALAAPFAYVANEGSQTLSVLDMATNSVTATLPAGILVGPVAVSSDGSRVYAIGQGSGFVQSHLLVVDTASNTVIEQVPIPTGTPSDVELDAAGTRVYVANGALRKIDVLDIASNVFVDTVPLTDRGSKLAVSNTGLYALSGLSSGDFVLEVVDADCTTNIRRLELTTPTYPNGIAANRAGSRVYVASPSGTFARGSVLVIDPANLTVLATVTVGVGPGGMAVNPAGTRVYVVNAFTSPSNFSPSLSVIDAASNTVVATVPLPGVSQGIAVDPTGARVYVADQSAGSVAVIDAATNTVVATVPVGSFPQGIAIASGSVPPPPAPANVEVTGIEVTQGIQNLDNDVPLISGRRTFVRVYARSLSTIPVPGVTATLSGATTECPGGNCTTRLLGSLNPVNSVGRRLTLRAGNVRSNLNDSFLFELPWEWSGLRSLQLHATLSEVPGPPPPACAADVFDAPVHELQYPRYLKIQFVRLGYSIAGKVATASLSEQRRSESWIERTYPLSTLVPAPDIVFADAGLGAEVTRTSEECLKLPVADRSSCANTYIMTRLAVLQSFSGFLGLMRQRTAGTNEYRGFPGDADGAYALIPQHPDDPGPGRAWFTRGACCVNRIGGGPSDVEDYAAHEIGHLFGREHPVPAAENCGHSATDASYPYVAAWIGDLASGLAGFDAGRDDLGIPMAYHQFPSTDFMSYCSPKWTSDYTYNAIGLCLREVGGSGGSIIPGCGQARAGAAGDGDSVTSGDWLLAFGSIHPDTDTARLLQTQRLDRIVSIPARPPGDHSIRLVDENGAVLADYSFAPVPSEEGAGDDGSPPPLGFGHVVPFVAGARAIQIVDASAGTVIGTKPISASPPVIGNVTLDGPDPNTGALDVAWTASDPDGDALTFDLFLTRDGGATFLEPLVLGVSGPSAQIDTANLHGGTAQIRVVTSDGVQTASTDSSPFVLANKPPQPQILNPADAAIVRVGQLLNLEGRANDPHDGVVIETGLVWSTPAGELGTGSQISITDLPVGTHPITLTATNSQGLTATTTANVTVQEVVEEPGPTLTAGPTQIGWHVPVGELQPQTAELNVGNAGSGDLEFTVQSSAPWLAPSIADGLAPTTLVLTADPAGFAGGTTARATVTLTDVGIPGQVVIIPVTLSVGNTFVVGETPPSTACANGLDDDADGFADLDDLGCVGAGDASEKDPTLPCDDGIDNDADGFSDYPNDPGCPFLYARAENPPCDDGIDNNGDGLFDFDDPNCSAAWPYWEVWPCGLGAELAPVLAGLHLLRRRRAATRSSR